MSQTSSNLAGRTSPSRSVPRRQGYVVVLAGSFFFVVSCFLRYHHIGGFVPGSHWASLYRSFVLERTTALAHLGGFLYLFAGIATIASIALAGLIGAWKWTPVALIPVSVVWSLTRISSFLNDPAFFGNLGAGYWLQLTSILVVAGGTISVLAEVSREPATTSGDLGP